METKLTRGMSKFYDFLKTVRTGEIVTRNRLLAATDWKEITLRTYLTKNKLTGFLTELPDGTFRIAKAGPALKKIEVARALTQVSPETLILQQDDELQGKHGTYFLRRKLGAGAVGHVWSAVSTDGESVAIKILNPRPDLLEPTNFTNVKRRFRRETRNGMKLKHPAVISHLDHGTFQNQPFLVMELANSSAKDLLDTVGRATVNKTIPIVSACLNGLAYLHQNKCVHRDVKPANILWANDRWVLGDLGIVRWSDLNPAFTSAATITKSSIQLGSWYYMAPEQLAHPHATSEKSDIYALGVTWYELLTASTESPAAFAAQQYPQPTDDRRVCDIIRKMTLFNPDNRPSVDEVTSTVSSVSF